MRLSELENSALRSGYNIDDFFAESKIPLSFIKEWKIEDSIPEIIGAMFMTYIENSKAEGLDGKERATNFLNRAKELGYGGTSSKVNIHLLQNITQPLTISPSEWNSVRFIVDNKAQKETR